MTAVNVSRSMIDGFEAVELRGESVRIAVVPALGAKVVSLARCGGREWMWKPAATLRLFAVPPGTPFDRGPFLGGDECLPTVAACRWRGRDLPDHGEVWNEAWELDESQLAAGRIVTRVRTPLSPLLLERTVRLEDGVFEFAYSLQNLSESAEEYLWAFHPMLNLLPGDRIVLPQSCRRVRTNACLGGCPLGSCGDVWDWPWPIGELDLARLDLGGPDRAVKLFSEPLCEGRAEIVNQESGERLVLVFDPAQIDTLGIWINRGGFGGFHHVALEPTNGGPDALDAAAQDWNRCGRLAAGETRRWRFSLHLHRIRRA